MLTDRRQRNFSSFFYSAIVIGVGAGLLLASVPSSAQGDNEQVQATSQRSEHVGQPIDWTTRHVIYTNGGSPEVAAAAARDPRFAINAAIHHLSVDGKPAPVFPRMPDPPGKKKRFHRDWAVSLGGGKIEQGETPAKYNFNVNGSFSCTSDFLVYALDTTPSSSQANIIAFNNLYTGTASSSCPSGTGQTPPTTNQTTPSVYWAYQAGTAAIIGSPVISLDGTKVAFLESGNPATLDVLTWVAGQGTSATAPATPGSGGSSLVRLSYTKTTVTGCTASSATNTQSSPYVDYNNDVAYVGDPNRLYRITGIFKGTPTLQYCVSLPANSSRFFTTSPVYDQITNQVFISDGNYIYSYTPGASSFTFGNSIEVSSSAGFKILNTPILDSTNGFLYAFSSAGTSTTSTNTSSYAIVSQTNLGLTSQSVAEIGPAISTFFVFDGDFDNAYFTGGPNTGAGTLYACGTQPGSSGGDQPSLYAMSFASGTGIMNTTPAMSNNINVNSAGNPTGYCSPLLAFYNGTNDFLFAGAGLTSGTSGANQVTEWNINTRLTASSTPSYTAPSEYGGTSGFVVDNTASTPQASSIYFSTLYTSVSSAPCTTGTYCAVKLTESNLQ
jgi:hypothetical protein